VSSRIETKSRRIEKELIRPEPKPLVTKYSFHDLKSISLRRSDEFICSERGSSQQIWIEDMILMKNFSQNLLLVESRILYIDYTYDDLGGLIELLDEV
jgi:hypothetical protein